MLLVVYVLLGVGILVGAYRVATDQRHLPPDVEPDGPVRGRDERPLTGDELVAFRLPWGVGYRKADVDRLLDRVARQLPRAGEESSDGAGLVPLTKMPHGSHEHGSLEHRSDGHGSQEDGHG